MYQIKTKILANKKICNNFYKLTIKDEKKKIIKDAKPGQFLNVRIDDGFDLLLRRPFSIYDINKDKIAIFYKVVGRGTKILAGKKSGGYLDILGPLGNGYTLNTGEIILVGGGTGAASLFFLAQRLCQNKGNDITILLGAKTKSEVVCKKDFENLGCKVLVATDDGSYGYKGLVSSLFKKYLLSANRHLPSIYACGPRPMLKEIASICKKHKIPCQVSLEEHMGCGVGACMGCVIKVRSKKLEVRSKKQYFDYKRICKDGPIFDATQVIWDE